MTNTSIVKELRDLAQAQIDPHLYDKAADEIERLRAAIRDMDRYREDISQAIRENTCTGEDDYVHGIDEATNDILALIQARIGSAT